MLKKKRFFGLIAVFSMLLALVMGGTSAEAAENVIDSVKITSVPTFSVGGSIADAKATVEAPEGCIAESHWKVWDPAAEDGSGAFVDVNSGSFDSNSVYYFYMTFEAAEGYMFDEEWFNVELAEGVSEGEMYGESNDDGYIYCWYWELPTVSAAIAIDKVEVKYPEKAVGNTATVDEVLFYSGESLVSSDNFDIKWHWECMTDNYKDVTGKSFEDGKVYQLQIDITPKTGYYLTNDVVSSMNGKEDDMPFATASNIFLFTEYSFEPLLTKAEITGLPEEKVGEVMPGELGMVVDVDGYEVSIEWYDDEDNEVSGQTMEEGNVYTAYVNVFALGYSTFSEEFVFIINGEEYVPTNLSPDENFAQLILEYEFPGENTGDETDTSDKEDVDTDDSDENEDTNIETPEEDKDTDASDKNEDIDTDTSGENNDTNTEAPEEDKKDDNENGNTTETDKKTDEKDKPVESPKTGDTSKVSVCGMLFVISACVLVFVIRKHKRVSSK